MLRAGSALLEAAFPVGLAGPGADQAGLWVLGVGGLDELELDLSSLDADERGRAARLRRRLDRTAYVIAHLFLRQLLGERLGVPPEAVAFTREPCPSCGGPHGRPAVAWPRHSLHFSLSRSDDVVVIGIAPRPVGVDVEAVPRAETVAEVSSLLHPTERREILSAVPSERAQRFARVWTRKEAYLKGVGVGVAVDLAGECVGVASGASGPPGWLLSSVDVRPGYAAAAAILS